MENNFGLPGKRPFLFILSEPSKFHKFIYKSQINLPTTLKSEILLNCTPTHQHVHFVCDLYNQIAPPLLSPHTLVQRRPDIPKDLPPFIIDMNQLGDQPGDVLKYILQNFHILYVSKRQRETSLLLKLKKLKQWQSGSEQLTAEEVLVLERKMQRDYCNVKSDDKVYLGVTAYVDDSNTNSRMVYAPTEFSSAIYNCSNSVILEPFVGPLTGGSQHVLRLSVSRSENIQVKLSDDGGWSALATNVNIADDNLRFRIPRYGGSWHNVDDTRLVHIEVIGCENQISQRPIKFLYARAPNLDMTIFDSP